MANSTDWCPPGGTFGFRARVDFIRSVLGHVQPGREGEALHRIRQVVDAPFRACVYCGGPIDCPIEDEDDDPGPWCSDCDELLWHLDDVLRGRSR